MWAGAETSPRTEAGSPSTEDSPHPWVVGVEMGLGGRGASAVLLSALTLLWLPSGEILRGFFFFFGGKIPIT